MTGKTFQKNQVLKITEQAVVKPNLGKPKRDSTKLEKINVQKIIKPLEIQNNYWVNTVGIKPEVTWLRVKEIKPPAGDGQTFIVVSQFLKISLIKLLTMLIDLLDIPLSGWTCFKIL